MMPLLIEAVRELDDMYQQGLLTGSETKQRTADMLAQLSSTILNMSANMQALSARNAALQDKLNEIESIMATRVAVLEAEVERRQKNSSNTAAA